MQEVTLQVDIMLLKDRRDVVAAIFGDHMVLPAATSAPVHGFGPPGATVSLRPTWGAEVQTRVGADGRWSAPVQTGARGAGGSMELICGATRRAVEDILFGDVWLASGQSNMEWPLHKCDDAKSAAAAADRNVTFDERFEGRDLH